MKNMLFAFLLNAGLMALLFGHTTSISAQIQSPSLPNIIYIYADDLGYGELGCYGQEKIKTPNLDRMAAEGIRFTQHYTGAPVCAPARCMLMTGKHSGHSYIRGNYELGGFADSLEGGQMPLPEGIFTLPLMLKKAGYATGLCGKWGLGMVGNSGSPLLHGFDYYFSCLDQKQAHNYYPTHLWENDSIVPLNNPPMQVHRPLEPTAATEADFNYFKGLDYAPAAMTAHALKFIAEHREQPFFLYLPYPLPHVSLQAPDPYVQQYIGQFNETPYYGQQGYASNLYPLSTYAAMITFLDDQVGMILTALQRLGLDDKTLVCFSSDNGTAFNGGVDAKFFNSVQGFRGLKMDVYEGGIRVPFVARWPGYIPPGQSTEHVSAQFDFMATVAELTGQSPGNTDGISFLPTMLGQTQVQKQHEFLYFEYPEKGGQIAIRQGDWKGVRTDVRKNPKAAWQVYNLRGDPGETSDLAASKPEMQETFQKIAKKAHQNAHVRDWEFVNPLFSPR